jgi:hypothetical protein
MSRDTGPQQWKMSKGFVTWHVRSLYRSGLLKAVSTELTKNIFDLLLAQGGGWDRGGTERAQTCSFYL